MAETAHNCNRIFRKNNQQPVSGTRLFCPKGERLADDFVQLGFGFAAAEGEGAGEMLPIVQREAVKFAGDEGFQRGAFLHVARVLQQVRGEIGQLLFLRGDTMSILPRNTNARLCSLNMNFVSRP